MYAITGNTNQNEYNENCRLIQLNSKGDLILITLRIVVNLTKTLRPSKRGELEITDLNSLYLEKGQLTLQKFERGFAWLDTGTHDALLDASKFVQTIQERQGIKIACIEEIAYSEGFINMDQFQRLAQEQGQSEYGYYLISLINSLLISSRI